VPIMKRRKEATGRSVREHVKEPLLSSCCESSDTGEDAIVVKVVLMMGVLLHLILIGALRRHLFDR
jgi:hypothetical protein